jgi:hypothetical protein
MLLLHQVGLLYRIILDELFSNYLTEYKYNIIAIKLLILIILELEDKDVMQYNQLLMLRCID